MILHLPILPIGKNTPLIKIKGNLIILDNIIIFEGLSVAGADINKPKEEKQKAAIIVPIIRLKLKISKPSKTTPIIMITKVIKRPNKKEAIISPSIIAHRAIGAETNLSKVLILVSQGATTGPIDETVIKSAMPSNPGSKKLRERFLPIVKAMNKKDGIRSPDIITGPLM